MFSFTFYATSSSCVLRKISKWYLSHGRHDLPWRKTISAYRVWISEIMLQQTQVITVIPFFKRFMHRFPTMKSFLTASEEEILALWSGLGYYRRARNIFQAKEIIKKLHKGKFPRNFDDLLSLPGIGRSTGGAIASIAYNQPFPILDTNVKRVLFRAHAIKGNAKEKELCRILGRSVPKIKVQYRFDRLYFPAWLSGNWRESCTRTHLKYNKFTWGATRFIG